MGGINSKVRRRRLATRFAEQGGLCHWCSQPMRLERPAIGEPQPDDLATIEHLDSKLGQYVLIERDATAGGRFGVV